EKRTLVAQQVRGFHSLDGGIEFRRERFPIAQPNIKPAEYCGHRLQEHHHSREEDSHASPERPSLRPAAVPKVVLVGVGDDDFDAPIDHDVHDDWLKVARHFRDLELIRADDLVERRLDLCLLASAVTIRIALFGALYDNLDQIDPSDDPLLDVCAVVI